MLQADESHLYVLLLLADNAPTTSQEELAADIAEAAAADATFAAAVPRPLQSANKMEGAVLAHLGRLTHLSPDDPSARATRTLLAQFWAQLKQDCGADTKAWTRLRERCQAALTGLLAAESRAARAIRA